MEPAPRRNTKRRSSHGRAGLALYSGKHYIRVNQETDPLFYFFDYDVHTADINMQAQHFHTFYEICILLGPKGTQFLDEKPYELQAYDIVGICPNVLHKTLFSERKRAASIRQGQTDTAHFEHFDEGKSIELSLVLSGSFRLLLPLQAGADIMLALFDLGNHALFGTAPLKTAQCALQRFIFLDANFRHGFPSLR